MTSKRQVTFPKRVTEALNLKPGDRLDVDYDSTGIKLRVKRFDEGRFDI